MRVMHVRRQTADAVTQTETIIEQSNSVAQADTADNLDVNRLTCPILFELFFDPVMSVPCGHLIESDAKDSKISQRKMSI